MELREAMGAVKLVALQRDKEIRAQFVSDFSIYEPVHAEKK